MNQNDYETIVTTEGPALVLSGPGSGKTHLLADRVKRLIGSGVKKQTITVLTFGVEAADQMRDRLLDINGPFKMKSLEIPRICTMHALGLAIVKEKPRKVQLKKTNLQTQPDNQAKKLLYRDAALGLGYSHDQAEEAMKCKSLGDCRKTDTPKCEICSRYRDIMSLCNCIDFDDHILLACHVLENDAELLSRYQDQCAQLLVDEYQDINAAQFRLIDLLSRKNRNGLFVVGDDAQSIYGFRGSDPKFILTFRKSFEGAQLLALSRSRRCPKPIMEDGFKVLKQYYKKWGVNPTKDFDIPNGVQPKILSFYSANGEAEEVAAIVRSFLPKKKVLILAPKEDLFGPISSQLDKAKIPYDSPIEMLPENFAIAKRFVDWLSNPQDNFTTRIAIECLINKGAARLPGARKSQNLKPETIAARLDGEKQVASLWKHVTPKKSLFTVLMEMSSKNNLILRLSEAFASLERATSDPELKNTGEFAKWAP